VSSIEKGRRKMSRRKGSTCGKATKGAVAGKRKKAEKCRGRRSGMHG